MPKKLDIAGQRFGMLVVTSEAYKISKDCRWHCLCDCGNTSIAQTNNLRSGNTTSCGCQARLRHGHAKVANTTPTYRSWAAMIQRCTNNKHESWDRYGGRGITVCERWMTFANFLADMGEKPEPKLSIDRINNDGDYEPSNCRWSTQSAQMLNRNNYKHSPDTRAKITAALEASYKRGRKSPLRGPNGQYRRAN